MNPALDISSDNFPCGCIVVDRSRYITYANQYLSDEFGRDTDELVGQRLETIMSRGSHLFCDSYVYPLLLQDGKCQEIQLTFLTCGGDRIPVIMNAAMRANGSVALSFFCAKNGDKLVQELVDARNKLAEQSRLLQIQSSTDELTGLKNRRALNEIAGNIFEQADQQNSQTSLLLLDLDDFKKINDAYGHCFGDNVLREVARCLQDNCRTGETYARYGGEEFVCILKNTDREGASNCAERIHRSLRETLKFAMPVTVSIGVATCAANCGFAYEDLLNLADKAMYQAKEAGKNRTVVSREIATSNELTQTLKVI